MLAVLCYFCSIQVVIVHFFFVSLEPLTSSLLTLRCNSIQIKVEILVGWMARKTLRNSSHISVLSGCLHGQIPNLTQASYPGLMALQGAQDNSHYVILRIPS